MTNETSGLKDALQYLMEGVRQPPKVIEIFKDRNRKKVLVVDSRGEGKVEEQVLSAPDEHLTFTSVVGLLDYLNAVHDKTRRALVMVSQTEIKTDLDYMGERGDTASVSMKCTDEYAALIALANGVTQAQLKKLLITKFPGCVTEKLLLLAAQLQVSAKDDEDVTIDDLGLISQRMSNTIKVTFPAARGEGNQDVEIEKNWVFTLPVWQCNSDEKAEFQTRLTLAYGGKDKGLIFTFNIRNHKEVLTDQLQKVVEKLRRGIPECAIVLEGAK